MPSGSSEDKPVEVCDVNEGIMRRVHLDGSGETYELQEGMSGFCVAVFFPDAQA